MELCDFHPGLGMCFTAGFLVTNPALCMYTTPVKDNWHVHHCLHTYLHVHRQIEERDNHSCFCEKDRVVLKYRSQFLKSIPDRNRLACTYNLYNIFFVCTYIQTIAPFYTMQIFVC